MIIRIVGTLILLLVSFPDGYSQIRPQSDKIVLEGNISIAVWQLHDQQMTSPKIKKGAMETIYIRVETLAKYCTYRIKISDDSGKEFIPKSVTTVDGTAKVEIKLPKTGKYKFRVYSDCPENVYL
ncbi:hypothetical protein [Cesiribacter sp. SM1]|uniref:hypothetical protein n=1 Tax=Cesiribacter sp. SM1 TaxID=2861196 RepID=UPI001CD6E384|nr:hypothetical protein [Cesiribacter sp. SM1]